jgi:sugar phosphate isomerase/epimerase
VRFGISAIPIASLIPQGISTENIPTFLSQLTLVNLIKELHAIGFSLIEISGDLIVFMPHFFTPESIQEVKKFKEKNHVSFTIHLPIWSMESSTPLIPVRLGSVKAANEMILATLPLQPEQYVLHATGALAAEFNQRRLPDMAKTAILKQFQSNARESIKAILGETGIPSRLLALETIDFPFDLTYELVEEMNLSMCLDTGHVLVGFSGAVELFDILKTILPRLGEIHLHDGLWQGPERHIGYGKDHQPLGNGDLDVPRLLDYLSDAQYSGPIIFELTVDQSLKSLDYIRSIRPDAVTM